MVKGGWRIGLFLLATLTLLALAGIVWLGWSSGGARWVLATSTRLLPGQLTFAAAEGRLADQLVLTDLAYTGPQGSIRADRLELRWQPFGMVRGELRIARLVLHDLEVTLAAGNGEVKAVPDGSRDAWSWPQLNGWPLRVRARIDALVVDRLRIRSGAASLYELKRLHGALRWTGETLKIADLQLESGDGQLGMTLEANLVSRRAQAKVTFAPDPAGQLAGVPGGEVNLQLLGGDAEMPLRGELRAAAAWGAEPKLQLITSLELGRDELRLPHLQLSREGVAGRATGSARCFSRDGAPVLDLDLQLQAVDLQPETRFATTISGRLQGRVDKEGYHGDFDLVNAVAGWKELAVRGHFAGGGSGIELSALQADWLAGGVQGRIDVNWHGVPSVSVELDGGGLDPARVAADWPGSINLAVRGRLDFPADAWMQARWQAEILPSKLLGRPLQGGITGRYDGTTIELAELALRGDGFNLTAQGRLQERLDVTLQAEDIGGLLAGATGAGTLAGWLNWQPDQGWAGKAHAEGRQLAYGPWQIAELQMHGEWLPEQNQMAFGAMLRQLSRGVWAADNLQVQGSGRIDRHRLELAARWAGGDSNLLLAGGWQEGAWRGELRTLNAHDNQYGTWQLQQPVMLDLNQDRIAWTQLVLLGEGEQRLSSQGALRLGRLDGSLELELRQFSLGWLAPWLADADLSGAADGSIALRWQDGSLLALDGRAAGTGAWIHGEQRLDVDRLDAELSWSAAGLKGRWQVDLGSRGTSNGLVSSRLLPQLALPERGVVDGSWENFDLTLLNPWFEALQLSGHSSGSGRASWQEDRSLTLHLDVQGTPVLDTAEIHLALTRVELGLDWDQDGLRGHLEVTEATGGQLIGDLHSAEPARLAWPQRGEVAFSGQGIDLALLRAWIPKGVELVGVLSVSGRGNWEPGGALTASGRADLEDGRCSWRSGNREVFAPLQAVGLDWRWNGESLSGDLAVKLGARGSLQGTLQLPLPARWPLRLNRQGALAATLDGRFNEDGLFSSLFPGLAQESKGELRLQLALAGTWDAPELTGTTLISSGGAYLPAAGVQLRDASVRLRLTGERLLVEDFTVSSGEGSVTGHGEVALKGWTPGDYRFVVQGSKLQAVNLPELQLVVNPDLEIAGNGRRLKVTGSVLVPEALFRGRQGKAPVTSSEDLVIVDAMATEQAPLALEMALKVKVRLGDHVLVKAEGVDARLTGEVLVQGNDIRSLTGQGRILVAEGDYASYGVRLAITRGSVVFAGGPVTDPDLDILALRELEEVKAGVRVTGTPRAPQVKLYSEPSMPDTDILAYIVLGHPLGGDSGQLNLMLVAAGALLSQGDSVVLQDRLKRQLGIDVIDVQTGNGETTQSIVTIGKYLSPQLYISFGQSVFSNQSQVGVRYEIDRHWQLESSMGNESGVDLFYRITFD
ncbi:hypothetical protein JCM30471_04550 [Desulfuromonas carbonis]|uniref:translocation/assembly module TamB domain-containing protein n=1 Tax=Desulfuromonas sp. DDH964 TaxID=1823759 RepID=UPI00078B9194|nr:translocation/assembly module TamB domain-containing protein [Desulfuromonas sp. DDH964]AMV71957.1 Translocation and assembly module TamB [Desulfuromonas sp. DDH964]